MSDQPQPKGKQHTQKLTEKTIPDANETLVSEPRDFLKSQCDNCHFARLQLRDLNAMQELMVHSKPDDWVQCDNSEIYSQFRLEWEPESENRFRPVMRKAGHCEHFATRFNGHALRPSKRKMDA